MFLINYLHLFILIILIQILIEILCFVLRLFGSFDAQIKLNIHLWCITGNGVIGLGLLLLPDEFNEVYVQRQGPYY